MIKKTKSIRLRKEVIKKLLEQPAKELPDKSVVFKTIYEEILLKINLIESIFWYYKFDRRIYWFYNSYCINNKYREKVGLRKLFYIILDFIFLRYITRPNIPNRGYFL
jgi:hypothetical protein